MTIIGVLRGAFRETCRNVPVVVTLYVTNLLCASVIALAFRGFVADIGNAGSLGPLLRDFDMTLFYDFLRTHGEGVRALWHVVLFMTLFSLALNAVASGGILAVIGCGAPFSLQAFLLGCTAFASRFLRLLLLTCMMTGLAAVALLAIGGPAVGVLTQGSMSEIPVLEGVLGTAVVSALVIMLLVMASDYARVLTVCRDTRSMVRALGNSFSFIGRNAPGAIGLQIVLVAATVCLFTFYLLVTGVLEMNSGWSVFFVFVVQQAFVLCRTFLRVMLFSSELAFARSRGTVTGPLETGPA